MLMAGGVESTWKGAMLLLAGVAVPFAEELFFLGIFHLGKQLGITCFSWLAARLGLASLPPGLSWRQVYGVSWFAGIGFTMSLFITTLAFDDPHLLAIAKVAILNNGLAGCCRWLAATSLPWAVCAPCAVASADEIVLGLERTQEWHRSTQWLQQCPSSRVLLHGRVCADSFFSRPLMMHFLCAYLLPGYISPAPDE